MNEKEFAALTPAERSLPDCSAFPASYLVKSLMRKLRRRLLPTTNARMVWTVTAVNDVDGPAANVRNYIERQTIRTLLKEVAAGSQLRRACEVGCGYGRLTMVLKEFAQDVRGFEREAHLVAVAQSLSQDIKFILVNSLMEISDPLPIDLVMTCTVLQHLTDGDARRVCDVMKRLAPAGHILLIEKTVPILVTANGDDGSEFLSRSRPVELYQEFMAPFTLIKTVPRKLEPTYRNPSPGTLMLFKASS